MNLEKIARGAPKRSPSPDNESWADSGLPGSGAVTPNISSASTPAEPYPAFNYNGYPFESQYRMNVPATSPYSMYSMPYPQAPNPDGSSQVYATTAESLRSQYAVPPDSRARGYVFQPSEDRFASSSHFVASPGIDTTGNTSLLGLSTRPFSLGQITYQTPSAAPATFRTAFRSTFPYSSLSPANFASRDSGLRSTHTQVPRTQNEEAFIPPPEEASMQGSMNTLSFDTSSSFAHPPVNQTRNWNGATSRTTEEVPGYLDCRTSSFGMHQ